MSWPGRLAGAVEQNGHGAADGDSLKATCWASSSCLQRCQPFGHRPRREPGRAKAGRRRAGAGAVFEGVGLGEPGIGDQPQGFREIGVALAGETDDEVATTAP